MWHLRGQHATRRKIHWIKAGAETWASTPVFQNPGAGGILRKESWYWYWEFAWSRGGKMHKSSSNCLFSNESILHLNFQQAYKCLCFRICVQCQVLQSLWVCSAQWIMMRLALADPPKKNHRLFLISSETINRSLSAWRLYLFLPPYQVRLSFSLASSGATQGEVFDPQCVPLLCDPPTVL